MEAAAPPPPQTPGGLIAVQAARGRTFLLVTGVLAIIAGFFAILIPALFSVATAVFIGIMLLVVSGLLMGFAFAEDTTKGKVMGILLALLAIAAGIYLVAAPLKGTFTLTVILCAWFIATGIVRLIAGVQMRGQQGAGMVILNGVVTLLLGVLIAVELPSSADWAIGLLVGIDFLFYGVTAIALAGGMKRVQKAAEAM